MNNSSSIENLLSLYRFLIDSKLANSNSTEKGTLYFAKDSAWPLVEIFGNNESESLENHKSLNAPLMIQQEHLTNEVLVKLDQEKYRPAGQWIKMQIEVSEQVSVSLSENEKIGVLSSDDEEDKNSWIQIVEEVLFGKEQFSRAIVNGLLSEHKADFFYLKKNEVMAATVLLYKGATAGIYMVATSPSFRRQGLSRKLMTVAHNAASAYGYKEVVLQATMPGLPLYQNMGYKAGTKIFFFKK